MFQNMFVVISYHCESSKDFKICFNKEMVYWVQSYLKVRQPNQGEGFYEKWVCYIIVEICVCHIYKGIQICDPGFIPKY